MCIDFNDWLLALYIGIPFRDYHVFININLKKLNRPSCLGNESGSLTKRSKSVRILLYIYVSLTYQGKKVME